MSGIVRMKMQVECPECGRFAVVCEGQDVFHCVDETGCAYQCETESLRGTLVVGNGLKIKDTECMD